MKQGAHVLGSCTSRSIQAAPWVHRGLAVDSPTVLRSTLCDREGSRSAQNQFKIDQKLARDNSEVSPDIPKLIGGRTVGSGKPRSNPKSAQRSRICPKSIQKSIKSWPKKALRFPQIHPSLSGEGLCAQESLGRTRSQPKDSESAPKSMQKLIKS